MAEQIHTLHIDRHRAVPLLFAGRFKFACWNNTCIIKQNVNALEFLHCGAENVFHLISLTHIRNHCKTFATRSSDLSGYLVQEFAVDVDGHNFCAFPREQRGRRSTDSRGRSGDDRRLILKIHLWVAAPVPPSWKPIPPEGTSMPPSTSNAAPVMKEAMGDAR